MPAVHVGDFADHVIGTLRDLGRLKVSQIAQELQDYVIMKQFLKKKRRIMRSGRGIQRQLFDRTVNAASHVGIMDEEQPSFGDHLRQITTDWVHARTRYSVEFRTDVLMNRGDSKVTDIIKIKRFAAMLDMIEELETKGWSAPTSSTDATNPRGIPYWIVTNATTGFNGSAHANIGGSTVGGVDTDVVTSFKNYTGTYANITSSDAVRTMRKAFMKIKFRSPETLDEYRTNDKYRIYCNDETKLDFDDIATAQNDNLKSDIAFYDGSSVFKKVPIVHVPQLDADSTNPIFMINHGTFYFVGLKGDFFRETTEQAPYQPNITTTSIWLTYNAICDDRRRNAVLYAA